MDSSEPTLGRYRLLRPLGTGGMGQVYLACSHGAAGFEKLVAIKVLKSKLEGDPLHAQRLLREALIGVRLDHENVVEIFDLGEEVNTYYIAMEYVRGFNLSEVLGHLREADDDLPLVSVVHIIRSMCNALSFVHGLRSEVDDHPLGLVHGDISPSNILLAADGRVKLSDFGVVALAGEDDSLISGKLAYMPLEALEGGRRGQNWDTYALGAVFYEALSAQRAFSGADYESVTASLLRGTDPLDDLRPDCPMKLADVAMKAIAKRPGDRFASIDEFRRALDTAFASSINDAEIHRSFIADLYGQAKFVDKHGDLPTTGGLIAKIKAAVYSDDTEEITVGVRRKKPLRFGLSPAHGTEAARKYSDELASKLSSRVGVQVRPVVLADYATLVDCLVAGDIDLGWMPPIPFVRARDRGASLLVVIERRGGAVYESVIVVRKDSGIESLEQLRGESLAWVDRDSASGYVFAAAKLAEVLGPLDKALKRTHFHGSHRQVCEAVLNGWATAGATYADRALDGSDPICAWQELLPEGADELLPLAFSSPIPSDNIACRPHLDEDTVNTLRETLRGLNRDHEGKEILAHVFHADRLVDGDPDMYDSVRAILNMTG